MIRAGIKIKEPPNILEKRLRDALTQELEKRFQFAFLEICTLLREEVRRIFSEELEKSDTWQALHSMQVLTGHFGIPLGSAEGRLDTLKNIWLNQIDVRTQTRGNALHRNIIIKVLEIDWQQVINSDAAHVQTDKGDDLPWLEWLLLEGSRPINAEYHVVDASNSNISRSHLMLMRKGGTWGVPAPFYGTSNDNFITRILEDIARDETHIGGIISQIVQMVLTKYGSIYPI
jgi:hypothetical protein